MVLECLWLRSLVDYTEPTEAMLLLMQYGADARAVTLDSICGTVCQ